MDVLQGNISLMNISLLLQWICLGKVEQFFFHQPQQILIVLNTFMFGTNLVFSANFFCFFKEGSQLTNVGGNLKLLLIYFKRKNCRRPKQNWNENNNHFFETKKSFKKQECTCPVCNGVWKESPINWMVCKIYLVRGHEDFIFGIYNTWFEIILIDTDFINTTFVVPQYLYVKVLVKF